MWLDRNEVEFRLGGGTKLYFCCFPNVGQSARRCMPGKDSKSDSFPGIHLRTASPPSGKTARASYPHPANSLAFLSKPHLFAPPLSAVFAESRKLCIGNDWLRYFSLGKENDETDTFLEVQNNVLTQIYFTKLKRSRFSTFFEKYRMGR